MKIMKHNVCAACAKKGAIRKPNRRAARPSLSSCPVLQRLNLGLAKTIYIYGSGQPYLYLLSE